MEYPKITIVTPSYNQGHFIEETILSVIGQNYSNLEYIIMDGGSTDNTVEIIKKYEKYITYWISEKDGGQSDAINKGFAMATGSILGWLNSDDMYMPNALNFIAKNINPDKLELYLGNCIHIEHKNKALNTFGSDVVGSSKSTNLELFDYIIQPSTFWTKKTWETNGPLRQDLHFGFDWEWFLRAKRNNIMFYPVENAFSVYRIHAAHKTGGGANKRQDELLKIYAIYNPFYKKLYELFMKEETINIFSFKNKIITKLFNFRKQDISYGARLKFLKAEKYKDYTADEINFIKRMN